MVDGLAKEVENEKMKVGLVCHLNTLVPEVYFYYFHCEGERKNKPLEPGYHLNGIPENIHTSPMEEIGS
jgi:hypothetical protein